MLFGGVRRKAAGGKTRNEGQISDTNWKQEIKTMKRTVVHLRDWVGCRGSDREGKRKWDFTSYFLDRLNKSIKARWRTLIELHKWDWGGTHMAKLLLSRARSGQTTALGTLKLIIRVFIPSICHDFLLFFFLFGAIPITLRWRSFQHFPSSHSLYLFFLILIILGSVSGEIYKKQSILP